MIAAFFCALSACGPLPVACGPVHQPLDEVRTPPAERRALADACNRKGLIIVARPSATFLFPARSEGTVSRGPTRQDCFLLALREIAHEIARFSAAASNITLKSPTRLEDLET